MVITTFLKGDARPFGRPEGAQLWKTDRRHT